MAADWLRLIGTAALSSSMLACGGSDEGNGASGGGGGVGGSSTGATSTGGALAGGSGGMTMSLAAGTCDDDPPPGAPEAPDPPGYSGGACPTLVPGDQLNIISSSGIDREFLLVVPEDPQPGETFPVIFLWHWLGGDAFDFYSRADAQNAVNQQRFIAVIPNGIGTNPVANWPWFDGYGDDVYQAEFVFFDDLLSCVAEQFAVNKNCVSSAGVSDGALWTSQLMGGRGEYLSSIIVLSGGVDANIVLGNVRPYAPSPHVMPAIVLWGGPTDNCIVLPFEQASLNLEAGLAADGHFIIECIHDCGHAEPPFEGPAGQTKFAALWNFVREHPYWLPDGDSPYLDEGLPDGFPYWCGIGAGSAVPRTEGTECGGPGCPF